MTNDAEARFRRLVARASLLDVLLGECLEVGQPSEIAWDDFVAVATEHLSRWARLETRAALSLLLDPTTAPASELLLRGQLEALAHLSWISEGSGAAGQRQRALCYELGRLKRYRDGWLKMSPEAVSHLPNNTAEQLEHDIASLQQLHLEAGCRCSGRNDGAVEAQLRSLAKILKQPAIYELWATSSFVAHQFGYDRIAKPAGKGLTSASEATLGDRVKLLSWVLLVYGYMGQAALQLTNPNQQVRFASGVRRYLGSPSFKRATREIGPDSVYS